MHQKPIPHAEWLSESLTPTENGYAYRLLECTEIILRLSLLRILADEGILDIFLDKSRLENYFSTAQKEELKSILEFRFIGGTAKAGGLRLGFSI